MSAGCYSGYILAYLLMYEAWEPVDCQRTPRRREKEKRKELLETQCSSEKVPVFSESSSRIFSTTLVSEARAIVIACRDLVVDIMDLGILC
jgi:hypothetical protein